MFYQLVLVFIHDSALYLPNPVARTTS